MGRGKAKRKMKQKIKRINKIKKGIHVPFSLANSPRKLVGRSHKHDFGTNIHNLIYVGASFKNVKYTSSNVTSCNFRNAKFTGIDFINTNLKKSKFKNAHFENVIFYTANLKGADFLNATFKYVYFINTNLSKTKNIDLNNPNVHVIKGSSNLKLSPSLVTSINQLMTKQKFSKHFVLTTKNSNGKKINSWIIYLLLKNFSEDELTRGFNRLYSNDKSGSNKNMHTYYSYLEFLSNYFKKMI